MEPPTPFPAENTFWISAYKEALESLADPEDLREVGLLLIEEVVERRSRALQTHFKRHQDAGLPCPPLTEIGLSSLYLDLSEVRRVAARAEGTAIRVS